jgi:4-amino-4-deoxy-L-arabinose transferase-like glycosyltransferase
VAVEAGSPAEPEAESVPPGDARWNRLFPRYLTAIVIAGAAVRLIYKTTSNQNPLGGLKGDGFYYFAAANNLADGMGYVTAFGSEPPTPSAGFPPLWTGVLGVAAWLGLDSLWSMRMVAILVGLGTVVLIAMAARQLVGPRAGLVAGGLAALYPGLWHYEWALLSETLLHFWIALFLVLAYRFWSRPSTGGAILLGANLALLGLTRAEEVLLGVLVVVPMILLARQVAVRVRVQWLFLAGAAALVLFAPWFVYNIGRFEKPVLISNGLGNAMLVSNCDLVYSGDLLGYYAAPGCKDEARFRPGFSVQGDQSEEDLDKRRVAMDYMTDHAGRLPVVVLARAGRSLGLYRPIQTMNLQTDWSLAPRWVGTGWLLGYAVLWVCAVPGLLRLRRKAIPIYPFVAFLVVVIAGSALTFGSIRYRAALEVPLVVLAGIGIDALANRWRRAATRTS